MTKRILRRLELIILLLTPVLLLLKAYDEIIRRVFFPAFIILGICIVLLAVLIFWKALQIAPKQARILCYYIATPAFIIAYYMSCLENKRHMATIFLFAALLYPLAGFIFTKRQKK